MIELLHTASLVHDDVVDDSNYRRGFFSVNAIWKNKIAVLVGDYLLSRGLLLSVDHGDYDLLKIVSEAVVSDVFVQSITDAIYESIVTAIVSAIVGTFVVLSLALYGAVDPSLIVPSTITFVLIWHVLYFKKRFASKLSFRVAGTVKANASTIHKNFVRAFHETAEVFCERPS